VRQSETSSLTPSGVSKPRSSSWRYVLLLLLFLLALALRVGLAVHFPSVPHPDEIFQTQEPAHRLAYGYGVIYWEWRQGVRSWVFPAFLAGVMRATDWTGAGSSGYLRGIVVVLSAISLVAVWFGFAWAKRASGIEAAIIAAGACATWWELLYFAPRALTEVIAGHILLPGLYLGIYGEKLEERKRFFLAGLFCGLAMSLRIQLAPAVAFAALYFCRTNWRKRSPAVAAGLLLPVLAFGLVDAFTWSYPFQSFFLYFWVNVVKGRAAIYGTAPWSWYAYMLAKHFGPILILALMGVRRSPFLGWIAFFILAPLSIIGHKEIRFLYPLVPIVITLAAIGIVRIAAELNAWIKSPLSPRSIVFTGLAFCVITSGFVGSQFSGWYELPTVVRAFDKLSQDSTLCGVGLYWAVFSGGYTHLHQKVPMIVIPEGVRLTGETASFNALFTKRDPINAINAKDGFKLEECWSGGGCLYRRPGSCAPPPQGSEINAFLQRRGE
jgi:GPI mannosyltransferase 3